MNRIKRILSRFRLAFRALYEGAQTYSTRRSSIRSPLQSARFDATASTRKQIVTKSRYFEQNNATVNKLVDIFESYTVGGGLQLIPSSSNPEWNNKAKAWWDDWCSKCDLTSRSGFGTLQSLIARMWFVDGESFLILTSEPTAPYWPRVQLVEGHLVNTPDKLAKEEGNSVIDGVGINSFGRPVEYYFAKEDQSGRVTEYKPVSASYVVHVMEPSRPGMYRGLPFVTPVVNDLQDMADLHDLEMDACKDAAKISRIIQNSTGELDAAAVARGEITAEDISGVRTHFQSATGATVEVLKSGEEYKQFASERPSVATQWYWQFLTNKVCAGVGIPSVLVFPESMQGTVYRGALDMANSFFRARSQVLADAFRRVYIYAIEWAIKNGQLPGAPADWFKVSIRSPRAVNVDVGRNSSAMLSELEAGATNFELIYSPLGLDWREELQKLKEQQDFIDTLGLRLGSKTQNEPALPATPAR